MFVRVVLLSVLFLLAEVALAEPDCGGKSSSHADERACWIKAARESEIRVHTAQEAQRKRIKSRAEDTEYIDRTLALFNESAKQFVRYRQSQCEFEASVAAGGNGAGDMRLSCQIALDEAYLHSLHEKSTWFRDR